MTRKLLLAFFAGLIVMAGTAYLWADRDQSDGRITVEDRGLGRRTETIAVDEVINDIRSLNQLVVFQAYITATCRRSQSSRLLLANRIGDCSN